MTDHQILIHQNLYNIIIQMLRINTKSKMNINQEQIGGLTVINTEGTRTLGARGQCSNKHRVSIKRWGSTARVLINAGGFIGSFMVY